MSTRPAPGGDAASATGRVRSAGQAASLQASIAKEELWPELERLGAARVRERLGLELYRGAARFYVEEWLRFTEFPRAREALKRKDRTPGNAANRVAIVAAGTIAAAAFLAHWTILD